MTDARRTLSKGASLFILGMALFFPTVLTYAYFAWGVEAAPNLSKYLYLVGKAIQFLLPVAVVAGLFKERVWPRPFNCRGVAVGALFGIVVGLTIFLAGRWGLTSPDFANTALVAKLRAEFGTRLDALGLNSKCAFLTVSVFYSIFHSGLEEYYWRWFTFGRLSERLSFWPAALATNVAFTLHHIVVLGIYFGFGNALTWICSFGVFVGGMTWQTIYRRSDSIYGGWISHGFIDAGIYAIGYLMIA